MAKPIVGILSEKYPSIGFLLKESKFGGVIYSFFVHCADELILNDSWEKIRNMIGVYFQSKLESDFERWNIYIFFITPRPVSKELKHQIEHDTISSRKIVVDDKRSVNDKKFIDFLLSEHVFNDNLKVKASRKKIAVFLKDENLARLVSKIDFGKTKKQKEVTLDRIIMQIEQITSNEV